MEEDISNGYIFISHSHKDIKKVRQIRNDMENAGFDPLCFYLKCLTDEDEIEGLIKREIDSRELFVYIDSPNSRESDWVKKERDYIDSLENKKTVTIKLENYDSMQEISEILIKSLRVYISYSHKDYIIAFNIANKLREKEFQVLMDDGISSGKDYESQLTGMIEDASNAGAVIVLLTENSINSNYLKKEITYAFSLNAQIIPVMIGDIEFPDEQKLLLINSQSIIVNPLRIENPFKNMEQPISKSKILSIEDEDFNSTIEYIADEIWHALKHKIE